MAEAVLVCLTVPMILLVIVALEHSLPAAVRFEIARLPKQIPKASLNVEVSEIPEILLPLTVIPSSKKRRNTASAHIIRSRSIDQVLINNSTGIFSCS